MQTYHINHKNHKHKQLHHTDLTHPPLPLPQVRDSERGETATGRVAVKVVGLTKDAVMQSGSLRISSISAKKMMESVRVYELLPHLRAGSGGDKSSVGCLEGSELGGGGGGA